VLSASQSIRIAVLQIKMRLFNFQKKNLRPGQTLLEAVIAIGVIMSGVVGSLVLVNTTIKLGRANQDRLIAQNLAREGIELVYDLRNSATLVHTENPTVAWDSYLYKSILKSGVVNPTYDIGSVDEITGACTADGPDDSLGDCDIEVLIKALYENGPWPDTCGTEPPYLGCDFDTSGSVNALDVTFMINYFYKQSYIYAFGGYPVIATSVPGASYPSAKMDFNFTAINGSSPPSVIIDDVWTDPRSRVYLYNNTYTQNVIPTGTSNLTSTKFYRVINLQSVCRGTHDGTETAVVVPLDSVYNCYDYAISQSWSVSEAATIKKVGILTTSEVRWPTALSSTKVAYQEYIYDWINF